MRKTCVLLLVLLLAGCIHTQTEQDPYCKSGLKTGKADMTMKQDDKTLSEGFPGDRRIRAGNYFQLDVSLLERNFINVWLPEGIESGEELLYFAPRGEDALTWKHIENGGLVQSGQVASRLHVESTMTHVDYGVALTIKIKNISDKPIHDIHVNPCVQLCAAPDLRDFRLERTFCRRDNQWVRLEVVRTTQAGSFYGSKDRIDMPLILVDSATSDYALGFLFKGAESVGGNSARFISCVHSNPPPTNLEPGETVLHEGRLFIHPQGKEHVLSLAAKFLEN
jgi:hypothetical protein